MAVLDEVQIATIAQHRNFDLKDRAMIAQDEVLGKKSINELKP